MPPNILVLIMDSVRAANCSLNGYHRDTTPFLSHTSGVNFLQARAPSNLSLPSHVSMFTGVEATDHSLHGRDRALVHGDTVWKWLQQEGYETGVFSRNAFITLPEYGLTAGFDTIKSDFSTEEPPFPSGLNPTELSGMNPQSYLSVCLDNPNPVPSLLNGVAMRYRGSPFLPSRFQYRPKPVGKAVAQSCLDWIDETTDPWGACLNFTDAHQPYLPTPTHNLWGPVPNSVYRGKTDIRWELIAGNRSWEQTEILEDLYDGAIHQTDAAIQILFKSLEATDELSDTLVVVTSDHGDCFGEECGLRDVRHLTHTGGVPEELLHVPLLIKNPNETGTETVDGITSLTRMPAVIRKAVAGDARPSDAMIHDKPVIASADHDLRYAPIEVTEAHEYVENLSGRATAVYDKAAGRKYIKWGDDTAVVDVSTGEIIAEQIPEEMSQHMQASPSDIGGEKRAIGQEARERLADLGYK
ncbi:sulfatase-like hydrolase/transferase [Haloarcula marina]|uniref:sulfatase-like hydrolase/transferase n=1 Tax=Haloarcula marina TaxID=2961574 RepID=UPI0020B74FF6|nr:sulfatase-like hydrolase/transferase [Halomicroarcula marina]